jgi:thiol:disulfide interchange protein DsbA
MSFAEPFVAGKDYEQLSAQPTEQKQDKKVPVMEFFSYGCPWCYRIDATLTNWVKQQGNAIEFSRVPVVFNKDWQFYAKAFYTAELLGLSPNVNTLLFKEVQEKKNPLTSNEAMISFFTAQGVEEATAKSAFEHSTTVDMHIKKGTELMAQYQISGVPAVIVNQQYKTDLRMAQSEERMIKILDFLVLKAKATS